MAETFPGEWMMIDCVVLEALEHSASSPFWKLSHIVVDTRIYMAIMYMYHIPYRGMYSDGINFRTLSYIVDSVRNLIPY